MKKYIAEVLKWCNKVEWLTLLLTLVVVLRIPSLFAPHHYGDEEIYFVMGRAWQTGGLMYAEAFDHKPPLIYIIAGIAQSVFWFRMILLGWMMAHTYIFWRLAQKIFAKIRPKLAYVASLAFVVLTSLPLLEGNIANAELFMMMPITLAWLLVWEAKDKDYQRWLGAGLVAGIALLFKVPVIFDAAAIVLAFYVFNRSSLIEGVRSLWRPSLYLFALGFLIPIILSVVNYQLRGVGSDYIRAALLVNFGYVSSWKTSSFSFNPLQSGLVVRGIILALYTLIIYISRKKLGKEYTAILVWLGFSSFGALLSARPYPHYLQQPIVPLSLLVPFIFVIEKVIGWVVLAGVIGLAILTQRSIGFWGYPTKEIYLNFWQYLTGRLSAIEYRETFSSAKMNYAVADYLRERLQAEDGLYVWGNDVTIYNLTQKKLTGGKYMVNFHVRDWQAFGEVMTNLEKNQPEFVVVLPDPMPFPAFEQWLAREYDQPVVIEGAKVYRRTSGL